MDLKQWLARKLPTPVLGALVHLRSVGFFEPHARYSFSREGEDLLLAKIFAKKSHGFYVDVGAHHPTRNSNTCLLYKKGWRGINIDATPGSMKAFQRRRPRDINLETGVSSKAGTLTLHRFSGGALNSVSADAVQRRKRDFEDEVIDHVEIQVFPLREILATHIPPDVTEIDLMTIDVEGHDFEVLKGNDWDSFRPRLLLVELLDLSRSEMADREEVQYLEDRDYAIRSILATTVVFDDRRRVSIS